jgi:hypothetical protein
MEPTDRLVLGVIADQVLTADIVNEIVALTFAAAETKNPQDDLDRLRREQTAIDTEIARYVDAIGCGGDVPELVAALKARRGRWTELTRMIAAFDRQAERPVTGQPLGVTLGAQSKVVSPAGADSAPTFDYWCDPGDVGYSLPSLAARASAERSCKDRGKRCQSIRPRRARFPEQAFFHPLRRHSRCCAATFCLPARVPDRGRWIYECDRARPGSPT